MTLSVETAQAVLNTLYDIGEYHAAGKPLPTPEERGKEVELVGDFLSELSRALGGPGRLA